MSDTEVRDGREEGQGGRVEQDRLSLLGLKMREYVVQRGAVGGQTLLHFRWDKEWGPSWKKLWHPITLLKSKGKEFGV